MIESAQLRVLVRPAFGMTSLCATANCRKGTQDVPKNRAPHGALYSGLPRSAWDAERFAREGERLIMMFFRGGKIIMRTAEAQLRKRLQKIYGALAKRIPEVVGKSAHAKHVIRPQQYEIELGSLEFLWREAIQAELEQAGLAVQTTVSNATNNTFDLGRDYCLRVLGLDDDGLRQSVARDSLELARRITGINESTRDSVRALLQSAINSSNTVVEVADKLRTALRDWSETKVRTVARTETMLAWNEATAKTMLASGVVTHVSVIGCESREEERWRHPSYQRFMYRGESTCNIRDVPVEDAPKLNFHPNHTGCMVPSRIRSADGSEIDLGQGQENIAPRPDPRPDFVEVAPDLPGLSTMEQRVAELDPSVINRPRQAAESHGMTLEAYQEAIERIVARRAAASCTYVRIKDENVLQRILNQGYKPSLSKDPTTRELRIVAEERAMGVPRKTPERLRPVYGYLDPDRMGSVCEYCQVGSYGKIALELKDEVRRHCTMLTADSFLSTDIKNGRYVSVMVASPLNQPRWFSATVMKPNKDPLMELLRGEMGVESQGGYWEIQIHKPVTAKDIRRVIFPDHTPPSAAIVEKLNQLGIEVQIAQNADV